MGAGRVFTHAVFKAIGAETNVLYILYYVNLCTSRNTNKPYNPCLLKNILNVFRESPRENV